LIKFKHYAEIPAPSGKTIAPNLCEIGAYLSFVLLCRSDGNVNNIGFSLVIFPRGVVADWINLCLYFQSTTYSRLLQLSANNDFAPQQYQFGDRYARHGFAFGF
jgi:hypothetical protein